MTLALPCLYPRLLSLLLNLCCSLGCSRTNRQYMTYAWYTSSFDSLCPSAFLRQSTVNRLMWSLCVRHMSRIAPIVLACVSLPPLSTTRRSASSRRLRMPLFSDSVVSSAFRFGLSSVPSNCTGKLMMTNLRNTASLSSAMSGRRFALNTSFALFFIENIGCPLNSHMTGSPDTSDFIAPRFVISWPDMSA